MGFLKAGDTISGQEARAYLTIEGRNEELFYAKKLESKVEKKKTEVKTLGKRGEQHKAAGWSGSGTLTVYYVTSLFRELMIKYMKTGVDTYFDMSVTNEDPTSSIGKQTTVLKDCNLDEVSMAMFDVESEVLEEDMGFTFDDVDLLDKFGKPVLG
ncbi:phage tail tube protein [Clostridium botulinum]|uniref:phage tail tube protein n=1 Tax=Clostridium botulinum TaxID=1491 RepID=UPI000A175F35|nr:phage tail tube protein [Clostridium botulinum]AWB31523.1 phage portal protein [Clostridium botulinum]MBO0569949.1 phage portal protein [Clostridium botulinum]MBY6829250.1 phage tail tube protein [Clostridium botulinum]MBY6941499.1 phage tail tube protein [Clostridium botulinum]MBY6962369.1 phage tail tube protein [Clostridium botulinum]